MFQNNNAMPVAADQLQWQFLHIDVNRPPYVPQIQLPQQLQQYLPYIAGLAASEIQNRAQDNPMRVFMFNLCAQNNFYNNDFAEIVSGCCDFVMLAMAKRQFHDAPTAAQNLIPRAIELFTAANCRTYPGLAQYVTDPNAQAAVNDLIQQFGHVGQEIANMKQMMANQNQPQRGGAGFVHQTAGSGGGQGQPSLFNSGSQASQPGFRQQQTARSGRWASKAPIEEQSFDAEPASVTASPFKGRQSQQPAAHDSTPEKRDEVPPELRGHPLLERLSNGSYMVPAQSSVEKWVPSPKQPYIPVFNPVTHMLFHQCFVNGEVIVVVKELTEAMMDWNKHNLGSAFGERSKVQGRTHMAEVWADVNTLNHSDMATSSDIPAEGEVIPVRINPEWKLTTSLDALLVDVRVSYLAACVASSSDILAYETYGTVCAVGVDRRDSSAVIENLSKVTEYGVLAQKLKAVKGEIDDVLWYTIDDMLTKAVNRTLRQAMSIGVTITRFSDDIDELIELLESKGPLIINTFRKNQADVIKKTLGVVDGEKRAALDAEMDMQSIPELTVTYIGQEFSVTVLDCMAHDLEIELADNLGAAVVESLTPEVHGLVKGIFDRCDELEATFARHLIITNDLKVLEATRGHIGEGFYALGLAK